MYSAAGSVVRHVSHVQCGRQCCEACVTCTVQQAVL